jgi:hypothetical protein
MVASTSAWQSKGSAVPPCPGRDPIESGTLFPPALPGTWVWEAGPSLQLQKRSEACPWCDCRLRTGLRSMACQAALSGQRAAWNAVGGNRSWRTEVCSQAGGCERLRKRLPGFGFSLPKFGTSTWGNHFGKSTARLKIHNSISRPPWCAPREWRGVNRRSREMDPSPAQPDRLTFLARSIL